MKYFKVFYRKTKQHKGWHAKDGDDQFYCHKDGAWIKSRWNWFSDITFAVPCKKETCTSQVGEINCL